VYVVSIDFDAHIAAVQMGRKATPAQKRDFVLVMTLPGCTGLEDDHLAVCLVHEHVVKHVPAQ